MKLYAPNSVVLFVKSTKGRIQKELPLLFHKAYEGTPRGEVCSKHKAIKKKKFEQVRISSFIFIVFYFLKTTKRASFLTFLCLVWSVHFATARFILQQSSQAYPAHKSLSPRFCRQAALLLFLPASQPAPFHLWKGRLLP